MASATYIRKRQERNSRRGKYGNEVKRRKMRERGADLEVVGWMKTGGSMGDHRLEICFFLPIDSAGCCGLDMEQRSERNAGGVMKDRPDYFVPDGDVLLDEDRRQHGGSQA